MGAEKPFFVEEIRPNEDITSMQYLSLLASGFMPDKIEDEYGVPKKKIRSIKLAVAKKFEPIVGGLSEEQTVALAIYHLSKEGILPVELNYNNRFTPGEQQIILQLKLGASVSEAASNLGRNPDSVKRQATTIYTKLGACTRFQAVAILGAIDRLNNADTQGV